MSLSERDAALIAVNMRGVSREDPGFFRVEHDAMGRLLDAARAEGVAALQQAAVEALRQIAALEPETMLSAHTDRYSGERCAYSTLDYFQVQEIVAAALPQQTALVEEGVEKIIGPHEPAEPISREAAARIIDPDAWDRWTYTWPPGRKATSLAKADAILAGKPSPFPQQGVEVAAYLIEQDDEPLAADLGTRMNYWRDKCITAGQRLDPKRWGPK